MKISYPKDNKWPLVVEDFDLNNATNEDIQLIGKSVVSCALTVIRGQKLTAEQEVAWSKKFGSTPNRFSKRKTDPELLKIYSRSTAREHPAISSVTGKLDEHGYPGLHGGSGDLDWHCGQPWFDGRPDLVYLYAVEHSAGSRTSYINSQLAYDDLDDKIKNKIADVYIRATADMSRYSETGEVFDFLDREENTEYHPPLVSTNKCGQKCIFLPFNQMNGLYNFNGSELEEQELVEYLKQHILQEKYIYHHDWQDGDITMHDNWNGLHKRWAFDHMDKRLLHRMQYDLSSINFE